MSNSNDDYESDFSSFTNSGKKVDLKSQLLKIFQDKGIVDKLRSQVRQNLINSISTADPLDDVQGASGQNRETDIIQHTCISMVAGFLSNSEFSYTLSVFVPEASVKEDELYSNEEILRMLRINCDSEFYNKLIANLQQNNRGFFWNFLAAISECHSSQRRAIDIQTESRETFIPISERMDQVDSVFESRQRQGWMRNQALFEERMAAYQRELDQRYKADVENEVAKVRRFEITMLKLKEEEKYSKRVKEKAKQLEDNFQSRLAALKDREQVSQTNVLQLRQSHERDHYVQRQKALQDMKLIQERELQLKKDRDQMEREIQLLRDKYNTKLDALEAKEAKLDEMEARMQFEIQERVNEARKNDERRLAQKLNETDLLQDQSAEDRKAVDADKQRLKAMQEELNSKQALFTEVEIVGYSTMKQKCERMQPRIDELEKELQNQIAINQADKRRMEGLMEQMTAPSHETEAISRELDRTRKNFQKFKKEIEKEKEDLEKRLVEEVRQKRLLNEQYRDQQDTIEHLTRQVSELSNMGSRSRPSQIPVLTSRSTARSSSIPRPPNPTFNEGHYDNEYGDFPNNLDDDFLPGELTQRIWYLDEETEQINRAYDQFRHRLVDPDSLIDMDEYRGESPIEIDAAPFRQGLAEGHQVDLDLRRQQLELEETLRNRLLQATPIGDNFQIEGAAFDGSSRIIINPRTPSPNTILEEQRNPVDPQTMTTTTTYYTPSTHANIMVSPTSIIRHSLIRDPSGINRNSQFDLVLPNEQEGNESRRLTNTQPQPGTMINATTTSQQTEDNDEIDPVMAQYMQLVKKKKESFRYLESVPNDDGVSCNSSLSDEPIAEPQEEENDGSDSERRPKTSKPDFDINKNESSDFSGDISADKSNSDKNRSNTNTRTDEDEDDDDTFW